MFTNFIQWLQFTLLSFQVYYVTSYLCARGICDSMIVHSTCWNGWYQGMPDDEYKHVRDVMLALKCSNNPLLSPHDLASSCLGLSVVKGWSKEVYGLSVDSSWSSTSLFSKMRSLFSVQTGDGDSDSPFRPDRVRAEAAPSSRSRACPVWHDASRLNATNCISAFSHFSKFL